MGTARISAEEKENVIWVLKEMHNEMTHKEIANLLRLGRSTVSNILNGYGEPGRKVFDAIDRYVSSSTKPMAAPGPEPDERQTVLDFVDSCRSRLKAVRKDMDRFISDNGMSLPEFSVGGLTHLGRVLDGTIKSFEI